MDKKLTQKSVNDMLRADYMNKFKTLLAANGEDILEVASNEFAVPCVDANGNDSFIVVKFSVPTGSRDGDPYDGYAIAEEYRMKCAEKEEKAKQKAEEKAKKIAQDKVKREQLAASKAKAKAEKRE